MIRRLISVSLLAALSLSLIPVGSSATGRRTPVSQERSDQRSWLAGLQSYAALGNWLIEKIADRMRPERQVTLAPPVTAFLNPAPFFLNAPTNLTVTTVSDTAINLSWTAPAGTVDHYQLERSQSISGPFLFLANAATTSFNDTTVSIDHGYLYRVRAIGVGGIFSVPSNMALGTATSFEFSSLQGQEIKAQHVYDLRTAVNAVRAVANLPAATWSPRDTLGGLFVEANDIQVLRSKLDEALAVLSIAVTAYDDPTLSTGVNGTLIKAVHLEQLQTRSTRGSSTGSGPVDSDSSTARLDPMNETGGGGENPLSRNFNWNLPLLSLPGRAGFDLGLTLSYNSLVWTRAGNNSISFDDDHGFPGPGFHLGFPVIQPLYYNVEVGKYAFLLIVTDGSRTELRQVGASALYEAADSSHLLLDSSNMTLRTTDGTQLVYVAHSGQYDCTQIKDRNGNYISVNYNAAGRISTITDTLGRTISFNYDASGWLTEITQVWNQNSTPVTHYWARFEYANVPIAYNFGNMTVFGLANNLPSKMLSRVTLADDSYFDFTYSSWGQVWKVRNFAADNHLLNYRFYDLPKTAGPTAYVDCPRFTKRYDWAQYWNGDTEGTSTNNEEALTQFEIPVGDTWTMPGESQPVTGIRAQVTAPDGTFNKIYFVGTAGTASGWQRGLPALVNTYDSASVLQRQSMTTWTQDNTVVSYQLNPRVTETNIYDSAGNRARAQIAYQQFTFANGTSCQLPRDVYEYAADAATKLRSTRMDYHTGTSYTDRRILGLVTEKSLYEGDVNNGGVLKAKVGFFYDNENGATSIQGTDAPVQHDPNYSATFITGRANLSSVRRYDVTNTAVFTTTKTKYNTAGAVVSSRDALDHEATISYGDSFSDNVTRNTLAYPTTVTDPDGYSSTSKYQFDFGATTSVRTPQPNVTTNTIGPEQTFTFDAIGRPQQQTSVVNGAYTRFEYQTSQIRVDTYTTIQDGLGEAHSFHFTDGAGRVIATATDHPGSVGGFSGQRTVYDVMSRVIKASNLTETSASEAPLQWTTAGDDAAAGWVYTQQSYDWKGRPLVTTNPSTTGNPAETTTKTFSYTGCGCAGGEVVTATDEGTLNGGVTKRRQRLVYSDVLGRTVKTQILDWEGGSVYSTTLNTYNAQDQVTSSKVYDGDSTVGASCPSGTCQETVTTYDGYGRVKSRHAPQQDQAASTSWDYNSDDTMHKITDGRGASQTISYNARHLITGVTYSAPVPITVPASLSFSYDAAGNRKTMTDELGSASYTYDQLSRMTSEARTFDTFGPLSIYYEYNLGGQLKKITDPTNMAIAYSYDKVGRNTAISGENTLYGSVSQYASNLSYRAWGALKAATYGNNYSLNVSFNSRLLPSQYDLKKPPQFNSASILKIDYQYYPDGSVKFADRDLFNGFDRAFAYDQVSMLKEAYSSGQAQDYVNGTTGGSSGPYRQTYKHDAFGNLNSRTGSYWGTSDSFTATYLNNRNQDQLWGFDSDGRLNHDTDLQYNFDAGGQNRSIFSSSTNTTTTMVRDGDGRQIKRIDAPPGSTVNRYYLRSSVLDGRIIAELSSSGQKTKGYVFGVEDLIAVQEQNTVKWMHKDPVTGSTGQSLPGGTYTSVAELDPSGVNVGIASPFQGSPDLSFQWFPMLVADEASCGSNPNCVRCTFEGAKIGCTMAAHMMESGFAVIDPDSTSPSTLAKLQSQPVFGQFCVGTPTFITGTPAGTPAGGSVGRVAGGAAGMPAPNERTCTTELVGYTTNNLAPAMNLIPVYPQGPVPSPHPSPTPVAKEGGKVYLCRRRANINGIFSVVNSVVYHYWLRTDQKEAGLGPQGGGVPGQGGGADSPYVTQTVIIDHKGESEKDGAICDVDPDADPQKVNDQLVIGKPMGRFAVWNNCLTFAQTVLFNSYPYEVQVKMLAH